MASDQTIRYWAASRITYARALLDLTEYARTHGEDFSFGPLDMDALEHQGLLVSGPALEGVRELLDGIEGLAAEEPS